MLTIKMVQNTAGECSPLHFCITIAYKIDGSVIVTIATISSDFSTVACNQLDSSQNFVSCSVE